MKAIMLIVLLSCLLLMAGCVYTEKPLEEESTLCPDGFVNWQDGCIAETITIYNSLDCPPGYAITHINDSMTCTAGIVVRI